MTVQDNRKGTERGQTGTDKVARLAKTHQDYWLQRLRKRSFLSRDGKTVEVPTWQVRLKHLKKEAWFNTGTANRVAAAVKARDIYQTLVGGGWSVALQKYKPESDAAPRLNLTVGDYLSTVGSTGYLRPLTLLNYKNCFRTIVSEAFGVNGDKSKFDYRAGGNAAWVGKIDRIKLDRVTPERVTEWQHKRLKKAGHSPVAIASAKRTINSYIRCARSLFSKGILKRTKGLQLPSPLPFEGVELLDQGSQRYISRMDARALIVAAKLELKVKDPEVYKVFLLGLMGGMCKAEIDLAEWQAINWQSGTIRVELTNFLDVKTDYREGEIAIDREVLDELRHFMPTSQSQFIVSSNVTWKNGRRQMTRTRLPRPESKRRYYRCEPVFKRYYAWAKSKGVKANKKLHEMRKECGAIISTEQGIQAAMTHLRHADITTTSRHYAQHKARITVGLGKFLDTAIKPADAKQEAV